ncbi:MAG: TetR family transcriptional regulator [Candidatus Izemoplasma sp.]|nr:TetR family transcriptional regulator [Candidatus Izemoplasma sp.]
MNKRQEAKMNTRNHILNITEELIKENGLVKVSSKDISSRADVAQGSIFLHFSTKMDLVYRVYSDKMDLIEKSLMKSCRLNMSSENFLRQFLDIHMTYEGILSRMVKDYPYMESKLKTKVDNFENEIKNLLFDYLRKNNVQKLSIVNSFIVIDAFYAQIKEYLREKTIYTTSNEYLKQKQGRLMKLTKILFGY